MVTYLKILPLMLLFVAMLLSSCNEKPKQAGMPPAVVAIEPVGTAPFKEKLNYLGTLRSRKSVTLSPNVEGDITKIFVNAGEVIEPGTKVMQIDPRRQAAQTDASASAADSVQSDLATAEATLRSLESTLKSKLANVEYTKSQHARYTKLASEGAVSQADADGWQNSYAAAQAECGAIQQQIEAQKMTIEKFKRSHKQALSSLRAQQEQLRYYDIVAPFKGMIGDIPVKIGDHVTSDSKLTTLTENHPLEVYVSIPAEKASVMQKGMKVELVSTDGIDYGTSDVIFISPTVDPSSQTVLIKTLYSNDKDLLRADQTVRAQVVWKTRDGLSVPTAAVTQVAGKYFVFVAQGSGSKMSAKQTEIEVLGIEGGSYQVRSGLRPTDRIVTTGIQRLADGAPIMEKPNASKAETTAHRAQRLH